MDHDTVEDHDHGLQHDLTAIATRMMARRRLLGFMGTGGAAALLAACGGGDGSSSGTTATTATTTTTTSSTGTTTTGTTTTGTTTTGTTTTGTTTTAAPASCVADPQETNGPYPSDGSNSVNGTISNILQASGVVRSDIRSSFGTSTNTAAGVPLTLTLTLANTNASCAALAGYAIYIWCCDRAGNYSLYSSGVQNENYLRGVQVTDANGQVTFTLIYPGCYSGRWPHIHFEVYPSLATATSYTNRILTSQFAMPDAINTAVYNGATGYTSSITNYARITLASDNVFGDNTSAQIAAMTPTLAGSVTNGFTGTAVIGLAR
jgi:protocatechuate 3,4-dioxygenase beta subunit